MTDQEILDQADFNVNLKDGNYSVTANIYDKRLKGLLNWYSQTDKKFHIRCQPDQQTAALERNAALEQLSALLKDNGIEHELPSQKIIQHISEQQVELDYHGNITVEGEENIRKLKGLGANVKLLYADLEELKHYFGIKTFRKHEDSYQLVIPNPIRAPYLRGGWGDKFKAYLSYEGIPSEMILAKSNDKYSNNGHLALVIEGADNIDKYEKLQRNFKGKSVDTASLG